MSILKRYLGYSIKAIALLTLITLCGVSAYPFPSGASKEDKDKKDVPSPEYSTAADVFINMPVDVLDLLRRSVRLDMVDYFKADSIYAAPNAMEGTSKLVALNDNYAKIEITPVSTLEIRLLPLKKGGNRIMTIYSIGTADGVAADSDMRFFDSNFKEIERKKMIKAPELADFFRLDKDRKDKIKEINSIIPFPTMIVKASPDADHIRISLTSQGVADIIEFNKYKDLLMPEVVYEWDGSKMQPVREKSK